MKLFSLILCLAFLTPLYGAFDYPAIGAHSAALANSNLASTLSQDGFIINPALSVNTKSIYGSLNYYRLFNLKSLAYSSGHFAFAFKSLHAALGVQSFGGDLYRESKITINSSRAFIDNKLAVGLSVNIYNITIQYYDNIYSYGLDFGFRYAVSPKWSVAGVIENINQPKLNRYSEELPNRIQLGFEYQIAPQLTSNLTLQKDAWFSPAVLFGIEYRLSNSLNILSGFSSAANLPSGGIGLNIFHAQIYYSVQHHFDLGPTHFVGIAYNPSK